MKKLTLCAAMLLTASMATTTVMAENILGIDVSAYQGTINWTDVYADGVKFAYVEATQGYDYYENTNYVSEMKAGKAAGLLMGAYDVPNTSTDTPLQDATYFWNYAKSQIKADGKSLMPAIVFNMFDGVYGASTYTGWFNDWAADIIADGQAAGLTLRPVILCDAGSGACDLNTNLTLSGWIANYNGENLYTGNPWSCCVSCNLWDPGTENGWTFWQVSDTGAISGISGDVDLDAYDGTLAQLKASEVVTSTTTD